MAIRCVYTDLDGTLLGRGASLFRDAGGAFTLLPARALEACHRAGVEVVRHRHRLRAAGAEARLGHDMLAAPRLDQPIPGRLLARDRHRLP